MSKPIPVEFLRECFRLDAEAGKLYWTERPAEHFTNTTSGRHRFLFHARFVGAEAGRINNNGYWVVTLHYQRREYKVLVHRIIWALAYGEWPKQFIDHINRVRTDNRLTNLRDVSHAVNMSNTSRTSVSKRAGLPVGVYLRGKRFAAQKAVRGRSVYLGVFDTPQQAHEAFLSAESALPA
jgi:hypothetical protein